VMLCFQEKLLVIEPAAVPKPTQVGGYKYTKAREFLNEVSLARLGIFVPSYLCRFWYGCRFDN